VEVEIKVEVEIEIEIETKVDVENKDEVEIPRKLGMTVCNKVNRIAFNKAFPSCYPEERRISNSAKQKSLTITVKLFL